MRQACQLPDSLDVPGQKPLVLDESAPMPLKDALQAWGTDRGIATLNADHVDLIRQFVKEACQ